MTGASQVHLHKKYPQNWVPQATDRPIIHIMFVYFVGYPMSMHMYVVILSIYLLSYLDNSEPFKETMNHQKSLIYRH